MDIAALSISMNQASLSQAVGIKLLTISKDQVEIQGNNLVQMLEKSVAPNLGRNLDILA
ncbi:hypothetical protein J2T13_000652 [Paenibacillus sp. DS2015]|uniref:YjfB family protein n=1 Tax=Paenibacillus sp. DS2015 TaxID=3373917 RepID=UPI003D1EA4E7